MFVAERTGLRLVLKGQYFATDGVLKGEQTGDGKMKIVRLDRGPGFFQINAPVRLVLDRLGLDTAQHRGASALVLVIVSGLATEILIATAAMAHDGKQVGLGACGSKKGRFEAEPLGGVGLQAVNRRVVAIDIVSYLGAGHGFAHLGGRAGHSIAAEINHCSWRLFLSSDVCILQCSRNHGIPTLCIIPDSSP